MSHSRELQIILDQLPKSPGVYLIKNRDRQVIYVGKAKNLYLRVRSYFLDSPSDSRVFVSLLEKITAEIETIVTRNEKEALLLENTLIKHHQPRYNVLLRDDKNFIVLRLDTKQSFPRLEVVRKIKDDGAKYFGPYHSAHACRQTLRLINRHFQLRTCSNRTLASRQRPCLQYQIGRCLGPCVFEIDQEDYNQQVKYVAFFLRGNGEKLIAELENQMQKLSEELQFEQAAKIRDQIAAIRTTQIKQQVISDRIVDRDVFGFYREGDQVNFVVLNIRQGKLIERVPFHFRGQEFPDDEVLGGFINSYYYQGHYIPKEILVPRELEDLDAKQNWLSEVRGSTVLIRFPRRGDSLKLLRLAEQNAKSNFQTHRSREEDLELALVKLQQRFKLRLLPAKIECYDVSSIQGDHVVASMVVMQNGEPNPKKYRRFKIKSVNKDDFASIYEVISRRLQRALTGDPNWKLPDLVLVDGGKAQLSMALAALKDIETKSQTFGNELPDFAALAKERTESGKPERVYLPQRKDPIRLNPHSAECFLLTRIRDEAHRFAIGYHQKLRQKEALHSSLEDIPGIGPKRRLALLKSLGSVKKIRYATLEELIAVPGMTSKVAEAVVQYFKRRKEENDDKGIKGNKGR